MEFCTLNRTFASQMGKEIFQRAEALLGTEALERIGKHRVIIHGILHLCGINDKGPGEREMMEAAENKALAMR